MTPKPTGPVMAVLFDMDGVLVEAKEWHFDALNDALGLFGLEISKVEHLAVYDGLPTRRKLQLLTSTGRLPEQLHDLINGIKQRRTIEIAYERCRPVFHLQYALARLKAEGYRMAVCSNSVRQTVQVMMERGGLAPYFDTMLSNEDVTHAKPHPEIYITAMDKLGLSPKECLVVEDNDHGVAAARASGAHLLRVGAVADVTYERITQAIHAVGT
jgi:beta-phosphoglucomutase